LQFDPPKISRGGLTTIQYKSKNYCYHYGQNFKLWSVTVTDQSLLTNSTDQFQQPISHQLQTFIWNRVFATWWRMTRPPFSLTDYLPLQVCSFHINLHIFIWQCDMALLPYSTNNSWLIFWRCHPELPHGAPFCIGSTVHSRELPIRLQLLGIHPAHGVFYDGSHLLVFANRPVTFIGAFSKANVSSSNRWITHYASPTLIRGPGIIVVHSFIFRVQHGNATCLYIDHVQYDDHANVPFSLCHNVITMQPITD
jgi:hypothetical protein